MVKLPPLPPELARFTPSQVQHRELDAVVEKYGQKCRDAALEEAAVFIESGGFLHDQSPAKLFADQLAPKIRSLR